MRLSGKTAIITGAASGFGAGIARKFIAEGAQVMLADLNGEGAHALASELGKAASAFAVNVADRAQVTALALSLIHI